MKKVLWILIAVLIIIQFITVDTTNPPVQKNKDFLEMTKAPSEIGHILKNACYDCHSDETKYPWYFNVAPVSWILKNHVNEARRHVNFSTWGNYTTERQAKKLDHCSEMINEGEMPLEAYIMMHSEAKLNEVQKKELTDYFDSTKARIAIK